MDKPDIRTLVGDELRMMRLRQKLSQERLAELANVERTLISDLERGTSNPNLYFFLRLVSALGENPAEVIDRVWREHTARGGNIDALPARVKPRTVAGKKPRAVRKTR